MTPAISRRKFIARTGCWALGAPLLSLVGCDQGDVDEAISFGGPTMGTSYNIKLVDVGSEDDTRDLARTIDGILDMVNQRMSTYLPESELSRFNAADMATWTPVSDDTMTVVERSRRLHHITGGAFDPTVGPIVDLWGFGPKGGQERIPRPDEIEAVVQTVGLDQVESASEQPALLKTTQGVRLDLSGVAKGFAVDLVAEHLDSQGIVNYLVEVGGELRARGTGPGGRPWRVGIEKPTLGSNKIQQVVDLGREAMATSGDYRIFFEQDGRQYAHIIDPGTGRPTEHGLASATVVAPTTLEADALSTALLVLGLEDGLELASELEIAAFFVARHNGTFKTASSPAFRSRAEG